MFTPGIHTGVADADYRADPALSQSKLKAWALGSRPRKARHFIIGQALEDLVQRPTQFSLDYYAWDREVDRRSKDVRAEEDARIADGRKACLKPSESVLLQSMAESLYTDEKCSKALQMTSQPDCQQVMCVGVDEDRFRTKCLLDAVHSAFYMDLKTTICATYADWYETYIRYGYHVQGASYKDMMDAASGTDRKFCFIVVSKTSLACWVHWLSKEELLYGREWYRSHLGLYKRYALEQPELVQVERHGNVEVVADA